MKEHDIRPKELFRQYLDLSKKDAANFPPNCFMSVPCQACGSNHPDQKFNKNGFQYVQCRRCGSLYCSPRPNEITLNGFNEKSKSARFWATVFSPAVSEVRREQFFRKKAAQIKKNLGNMGIAPRRICDIGAGYGIFLEELHPHFPVAELYAIEPGEEAAFICRQKGFETLATTAENSTNWAGKFDFVVCSEVIEHVFSPIRFMQSMASLLSPAGICLLTGLGYEGFDILSLQEKSNSIFPPHHLNFLSIQGFKELFSNNGLCVVEIATPGELDLDIVLNSGIENEFVKVIKKRGDEAMNDFQNFLQKHNLSSHVWIWGKKQPTA